MSLASYSGLKTAVAQLLNRSDLTDYIPDWITMAEATFNRNITSRYLITTETITVTGSTYPLPDGFSAVVSFWLDQDTGRALEYVTPDVFDNITDTADTPYYYTISGEDFYFAPPPGGTFTLRLRYRKNLVPLSDDAPSNWLLAQHPDIYLYGAAIHSAPFLNDDQRIVMWQGKHDALIDEINRYGRRELQGSRLQTSSGLRDRGFIASGTTGAGWH
jgi:hypothetical protein